MVSVFAAYCSCKLEAANSFLIFIKMIVFFSDHPRTVHSGTFISLTISVTGIVLTEMSSGETISKHDMQGISFASGGEKVILNNLYCYSSIVFHT